MNHTYNIQGMTCEGCKAKVRRTLEGFPEIDSVDIDLSTGKAQVTMNQHVSTTVLQQALSHKGNYSITEEAPARIPVYQEEQKGFWLPTSLY